jgi:plastocyanin
VTNYGNESNDGQGQILRVAIGSEPATAPAVPLPDESKSYALAQPTPVGQAGTTAEIAGDISMVEGADPTQWGFDPKTLTVQVGQAVRFTNTGKISHTATQSEGAFDTGFVKGGEWATITFTTPGTFSFFCQPHPWMQGTVVVQGDAGATTKAAAVSTPEENVAPPSISALSAVIFVAAIIGLVFGLGFATTKSKRRFNRPN